jgi:hypothetical protein
VLGIVLAFPLFTASPLWAAVFTQKDAARLSAIIADLQSLRQDVTTSMNTLPSLEVEKINTYSFIQLNLEAAQERLTHVLTLIDLSIYLQSASDEARVLNALYVVLLPPTKGYLNSKMNAIVRIASIRVNSSDAMIVSYSTRASNILTRRTEPLLDELLRRIAALHK